MAIKGDVKFSITQLYVETTKNWKIIEKNLLDQYAVSDCLKSSSCAVLNVFLWQLPAMWDISESSDFSRATSCHMSLAKVMFNQLKKLGNENIPSSMRTCSSVLKTHLPFPTTCRLCSEDLLHNFALWALLHSISINTKKPAHRANLGNMPNQGVRHPATFDQPRWTIILLSQTKQLWSSCEKTFTEIQRLWEL